MVRLLNAGEAMTASTTPPADDDLVFICGALRSGTTLLRLMINDHPALSNPGEMDFLFERPALKGGVPDMAAYARELRFNRVFTKLGLSLDPDLRYEEQIRALVSSLRTPGKRLSINIHRHFDRIPVIFPEARFVHMLRDPRDVAKSSIGMGWAGNVYHGVDHWIASERDFERLSALVPTARIHTLRYEDLLRAPETELARLCGFLGVAFDPAMLDYPSHTTYGAPDASLIDQWRRELGASDIALVEGKLGGMLATRRYEPSGERPRTPGAFESLRLSQANRIGRIAFSARRNGVFLTLFDLVARRSPWPALRDFSRRRIARNELRFLK